MQILGSIASLRRHVISVMVFISLVAPKPPPTNLRRDDSINQYQRSPIPPWVQVKLDAPTAGAKCLCDINTALLVLYGIRDLALAHPYEELSDAATVLNPLTPEIGIVLESYPVRFKSIETNFQMWALYKCMKQMWKDLQSFKPTDCFFGPDWISYKIKAAFADLSAKNGQTGIDSLNNKVADECKTSSEEGRSTISQLSKSRAKRQGTDKDGPVEVDRSKTPTHDVTS